MSHTIINELLAPMPNSQGLLSEQGVKLSNWMVASQKTLDISMFLVERMNSRFMDFL